MKKNDQTKQRLLNEAREMAKDLYDAGVVKISTMREIDVLCIPEVHELSPAKIKKIRSTACMSQAVFAKVINVSPATVKQWECGKRKPSGGNLKLLNIAEKEIRNIL